jgi:type I restriction enzyme, S subunit
MASSATDPRPGVLGEIADVVMGLSPVGTSYNQEGVGVPLINGPTEFTRRHPVAKQWTTAPARFCKRGDTLICVRGSSTGRMNVADTQYCIGRGVAAVTARGDNHQEFVKYALTAIVSDLLKLQAGSTFPSIDARVIRGGRLLIPEPAEQRMVAEALKDADDHIDALERKVAKKLAVKRGMMQQLLVGATRLPGFSKRWQTRRFSELLAYEQPSRYLVATRTQADSGLYPVLTPGKTFIIGYTNETKGVYRNNPVIIFDDFTTSSKYVDFDFKVKSSAIKLLTPREDANLRFVYERMQVFDFHVGDHKRYWISEYAQQAVLVPERCEQDAIARVSANADREVNTLTGRLLKAQAIRAGMMQELLSGRARLPVEGVVG